MQLIQTNAGKLRNIGYEAATKTLYVELEGGRGYEYANIGESIWQQFKASANQWSYFRDNIEEEYTARPAKLQKPANPPKQNPLDDLFN